MKRFNAACGWLMAFLILMIALAASHGERNPVALMAAFLAVLAAWLLVTVGASLYRAGVAVRCFVLTQTHEVRYQDRLPPQVRRPQDLIERLCRESGWLLTEIEGDYYRVRAGDHRAKQYVSIRYSDTHASVVFQTWFPVRFSLEREPKGLFARLLLRNFALTWGAWDMVVGESCEACLFVGARVPAAGLNAPLFDAICGELVGEIRAFHLELHEKFSYAAGGGLVEPPPQPYQDILGTVEIRESLPNGPVRYRLPRS